MLSNRIQVDQSISEPASFFAPQKYSSEMLEDLHRKTRNCGKQALFGTFLAWNLSKVDIFENFRMI